MQAWPRKRSIFQLGIAVVLAALVVLLVLLRPDRLPAWLALAGPLLGGLDHWLAMRRFLRRRRLQRVPFPESWRRELQTCVPFYYELDDAGKQRFEDDIRFFLAEQQIYGPRGTPVDEGIRVLIAAGAAMLGSGLPGWEWPRLRDIIVYPTSFSSESYKQGGDTLGMVHHQGPIIFSERALKLGFCNPQDGQNVGLHELAHVMDLQDGSADGIPAGVSFVATAPWVEVIAETLQRVRRKRRRHRQVLRRYAGTNEAELFAVAVEVFFEKPDRLKQDDPELYELLAEFFNQDPAE